MIISPPEHGCRAAVLGLDALTPGITRISVKLHVLEGAIGVGLGSRSINKIFLEAPAALGKPMDRIVLDIDGSGMTDALFFTNRSQSGPAKALVHAVSYEI